MSLIRLLRASGSRTIALVRRCKAGIDPLIMNPSEHPALHFRGGANIALKLPPAVFDATLTFYRDTLKLPVLEEHQPHWVIAFGGNQLWLDPVEGLLQPEVWLEIVTSDTVAAREHLSALGVTRCDEVESLPAGFDGFWIRSPAATVHLVCGED